METIRKKIKVIIEKTNTGFSAFAVDYPVYTTGKSLTELSRNIIEALNYYFEESKRHIAKEEIDLQIDLKQFFKYYRVLNAKFLAERIGMNPTLLSQYVQGRKRPSAAQTQKILSGINEIGKELSEVRLLTL